MGGLYEIKEKYPHIQVVSSLIEKPYIEGTKKSLRLEQAEKIYPTLSEAEKINAEYFHNILKSIKHVPVDITIDGDKELDWCGGIKIIATPDICPVISLFILENLKHFLLQMLWLLKRESFL